MPDPNTPDPSAVLGSNSGSDSGSVPPPPALNNAPLNNRQAPPAPPAQGPSADSHSTLVGRVFKHVTNALEGKQTQYVPDTTPDGAPTGQVKEVEVPRKAGGLFRDILGGMLTGMAAGATHPKAGLGGLGLGYAAAQDRMQQQDDRTRQRATQQAQAQKVSAGNNQQNDLASAAVAQQTMNTLHLGHNIGLHDDKEVDAHNNAQDVVKGEALKAGGQLAQVDNNNTPGNGPALMQAFNKDPRLMQGPEGFHRIPFVSYDTKDLQHKDGKWVEADGSEPDWNKRATVSLVDLPNQAWGKTISLPRHVVNDVGNREISSGKPTDNVNITYGGLFSLGLKNVGQMNADREERERGPQDEKEAESWVATAQGVDKDSSDYAKIQKRAEKGQAFLDAKSQTSLEGKAPTKVAIQAQTEQLSKNLANYAAGKGPNLSPDDRATLVQRQKDEAVKGVPEDIIASIGSRPVPAQFDKGEDDPAYKVARKMWGDASLNAKTRLQAASGMARYQMMGDIRDYNVTNTTDRPLDLDPAHPGTNVLQPNESGRVTANQLKTAPSGIILNTQDGLKVMSKGAIIRDIQTNVDNLRDKFEAVDNMDAGTRAKLVAALRDPDPESALHNFSISEGKALTLDPKLSDLVINMQQMAENVMALRTIQGIGGGGSDMARRALMNLVPNATTPSKEYAGKQLDAFQRTLNQLKTGVPTVGGRSLEPVSGARNPTAAQPSAPPKPDTHVFSLSAWQKANPKGDVNAAKAAAQKAGFTVQN